jgi:hypothetical protein
MSFQTYSFDAENGLPGNDFSSEPADVVETW